eukprot:17463_1
MVSFIMVNAILFDHLRTKIIMENNSKMMHCKLLYQHNFVNKFDMKIFTKTIENKSNILILFLTEFNHMFALFFNKTIQEEISDCKMFALLLQGFLARQLHVLGMISCSLDLACSRYVLVVIWMIW